MVAIVEVSIIPMGTATPSVSKYVADCHRVLKGNNQVKYQITPMGTVLEGDLGVIFSLIQKMHEIPFASGALRVYTNIKIDDRRDKPASMEQKLNSVQEKMSTEQ